MKIFSLGMVGFNVQLVEIHAICAGMIHSSVSRKILTTFNVYFTENVEIGIDI